MNIILKKILFSLNPEHAHALALNSLQFAYRCGLAPLFKNTPGQSVQVMGLTFPNPFGLAAGFDKNGDYIDALAMLGFGFIEIGTLTPKPQLGNSKPRLFRLDQEQAIINRMGFNNKGVDYAQRRLEKTAYRGILGINIGKNKDTPLGEAVHDYLYCFRQCSPFASYMTINISSPNTPGLRDLQQENLLTILLYELKQEQAKQKRYVPLVVKISPDLSQHELESMATIFLKEKIDGVIATNTTLSREGVAQSPYAKESGGLSGKPLLARSTAMLAELFSMLQDQIPIIASGGVMDKVSAQEKLDAGAKLVQIYSGFIFSGASVVKKLQSSD